MEGSWTDVESTVFVRPSPPAPQIFAASLGSGCSGIVYRLPPELTVAEAVIERRAGRDIVVCGPDLKEISSCTPDRRSGRSVCQGCPTRICGTRRSATFSAAPRPPTGHSF